MTGKIFKTALISVRVPLEISTKRNIVTKITFKKLKKKSISNDNNKKINKIDSLLQFIKNFFYPTVHERRCASSCNYVRAYLIPDNSSKK